MSVHPTRAWIRNSTRSKTWRWIWGNLVWDALDALAPWAAKSIVDLGCGTGFWLPRYAKSAHTVIGVETGTSLLAAARARTGAAVVLHGSAEHLPLAVLMSSTPGSRISFRRLPTTALPDWPRPCGCFGPAGHSS